MGKKQEDPLQYSFVIPSVHLDKPQQIIELTVNDLPDIAAEVPWQVLRDYHEKAREFGVDVRLLKYAEDTYHGSWESFIEFYLNTGSITQANECMALSETGE